MTTSARPRRTPRRNSTLEKLVLAALDDMKAVNVKLLDVRGLTDIADTMIVACGNSDRHVRAIADHVVDQAKQGAHRPLGIEGMRESEWVLVDLQDVLVHVMLPRVREFYSIEQLWEPAVVAAAGDTPSPARARAKAKAKAKAKTARRRPTPQRARAH